MPAKPGVQRRELLLLNTKGLHGGFLSEVLAEVVHRPVRVCDWKVTGKTREVKPPPGHDPEESVILHEVVVSYHET